MDDPPYPLTLDPVGQPPVTGLPDRHVSELDCGRINHIQNGPESSSGILDTARQTSSNVSADQVNIGTVGRGATSIGATPSSDSGVHSWKEQWENMSELSSDDASGQPVQPDWSSPKRDYMSDIRTPPNTEEEGDSNYPWRDRMVSRISCGSSLDTRREEVGVYTLQCPEWQVRDMQTSQSSQTFPTNWKKRIARNWRTAGDPRRVNLS